MIPVRPSPPRPPPPPPNGSSPPPLLWCGEVVGCFPPACGVVWSGGGSGWGGSPLPPCGMVCPCVFRSALGVWYTHPYDDNDDDDGDDDHHHH